MHAKSSGYYSGYYDEGVAESRRRIPGWLPQVLGYSLSAGCLIWVLHGYPLNELGPTLRSLDYRWVGLAVAGDLAVYVVHGWRWTTLLALDHVAGSRGARQLLAHGAVHLHRTLRQ